MTTRPNPDTAPIDEVDAWSEKNEAKLEKGIKTVLAALDEAEGDMRPSGYVEMARLAGVMLNVIAESGDAPEYLNQCILSGEALGELLLQNVPSQDNADWFDKRKWLEVAEVLGPDHAQTLYRAAVFTTKVA